MPVRQRGKTWQADVTWNGERLREGGFESQMLAEHWETKTLDRLRRGIAADTKQVRALGEVSTLKELRDKTVEQYWKGSKAEATTVPNADFVIAALGEDRSPNDITTKDVDSLRALLRDQGLSGGTINRKLATLSRMLRHGHSRGWVDRLPMIQRQREAEHRIRWLTEKEERDVLFWCRFFGRSELQDLVTVLIDSGLRLGEALRLKFSDAVDGWMRVWKSKNFRPRSVPMTDRVVSIINRRRTEAGDRDTVFTLNARQAIRQWSQIREKLGLEDDDQFVLHALRHTCASRLVQAGVDLPSIQQIMGHTTINTTMRYAHLAPKNLVNAMAALQGGVPLSGGKIQLRLAGEPVSAGTAEPSKV